MAVPQDPSLEALQEGYLLPGLEDETASTLGRADRGADDDRAHRSEPPRIGATSVGSLLADAEPTAADI